MSKSIITTASAPAPIGPYNQAVSAGGFLFISGQVCINPADGNLMNADIRQETDQVMKNLSAILNEAGLNFNHVVKTTIFITDMKQFADINEVYGKYFESQYPARETVEVSALPKFVNVEISMIAVRG